MPYNDYAALLKRGASPAYSKINNDTFRTLATDVLFARRVSQNSIVRLLNTMAWTLHDANPPPTPAAAPPAILNASVHDTADTTSAGNYTSTLPGAFPLHQSQPLAPSPTPTSLPSLPVEVPTTYVQGMNVLAAPILYVARSEPQALSLLRTLLTTHLPSYITPTMSGVHSGLSLLDRLLAQLDPPLHAHLASKSLHPSLYAFPSILTLSACTPPLPEVLVLWDFLFAWGVHLNVLAVVAQLVLMREKLLASESPGRELRGMGPLRGRKVVELVVAFVPKVGEALWSELVGHTAL